MFREFFKLRVFTRGLFREDSEGPKRDPSLFLEKCIPAVRATARTDEHSRSVRHDPEEISPASDKTCDRLAYGKAGRH